MKYHFNSLILLILISLISCQNDKKKDEQSNNKLKKKKELVSNPEALEIYEKGLENIEDEFLYFAEGNFLDVLEYGDTILEYELAKQELLKIHNGKFEEADSLLEVNNFREAEDIYDYLLENEKLKELVVESYEKALTDKDAILNKKRIYVENNLDSLENVKSRLLGRMRIKNDDMKGSTFYTPKSAPKVVNYSGVYGYIGQSYGSPSLRFVLQYAGDDWLFIESMIFKCDLVNKYGVEIDFKTTIEAEYDDFKRDNDGGRVFEWIDKKATDNILQAMIDISMAKSVKLRVNGSTYYDERNLKKSEINAVKDIVQLYELMDLYYDVDKSFTEN